MGAFLHEMIYPESSIVSHFLNNPHSFVKQALPGQCSDITNIYLPCWLNTYASEFLPNRLGLSISERSCLTRLKHDLNAVVCWALEAICDIVPELQTAKWHFTSRVCQHQRVVQPRAGLNIMV